MQRHVCRPHVCQCVGGKGRLTVKVVSYHQLIVL